MTTPAEATPAPEGTPAADPAKTELAALSEQVAHMAHIILASVPENMKALIPSELSPAQQVAWFQRAKETGVFNATVTVPATDSGKPTVTPKTPDVSTLPPVARMAAGYGAKH
ncbi:hypothetical protein [Magnetospirillum sp. 64-120]|uniref:hypothetical protein n=1 Tax=Magnetospirillum sp. 64-120 TaxID=1895778 RepID=UPI000927370E|nr:hypothetical protein [Magnetospirillum sp. 64-120]OJX65827.1 MAG: hypothetical protein BGO92_06955 [Magnetospirillum sp. 64-120]